MFITGVNDTGNKLFSGVNDTSEKIMAGVNNTGDNDTGEHLWPVTRTRTPWRWGAAKDRRRLKGIIKRFLRPPMVSLEPQ
jgi:hypothetical protein